ncbi:glycoside hydrolase family 2 protein [Enterococcus massiliensis]|uniref:glycoside hydrolase family 2 protein n=1 Tax=Enterococcus massiliensis TaxID=1640685 RepID=UPI00065E6F81|nr:glycoside hydrolase family 2 [Enterococcus massiliensis]
MMVKRKLHPRPQFIRENWTSLDGQWDFKFDDKNIGLLEHWQKGFSKEQTIIVPFTYETKASGIHKEEQHSVVWYQKNFKAEQADKLLTLNFEGVDYETTVWINGHLVGAHRGAYERFSFDISRWVTAGENLITLRAEDSLDCEQPRGKQRWKKDNFGCWYVQTTGIWKSVWLEERMTSVSLELVKITPDLDADQVVFRPRVLSPIDLEEKLVFEAIVTFSGEVVNRIRDSLNQNMQAFALDTRLREDPCWGTKVWWPNEPNLYDVTFRLYNEKGNLLDEISSYFGMRKIHIQNGQVLLNNTTLYQRLILDQGYWPESSITPPSVEALEVDIHRIKELGYNGLRKHQKLEDERFLYLCDVMGMLVWSEMPSTYTFNDIAMENFIAEWQAIVKQYYNHPSIITWVPFNESWGIKDIAHNKEQQAFTETVYHLTKAYDKERPVITNDGWVHTISDILTLHDYEEYGEVLAARYADKDAIVNNDIQFNKDFYAFADGYNYQDQPIIISEFGGIAFSTSKKEEWGYGHQVKNDEEFMDRFDKVHQAVQDLPYVVGYCYTQLTDVEQEINGLLDVNRKPKLAVPQIAAINERRLK